MAQFRFRQQHQAPNFRRDELVLRGDVFGDRFPQADLQFRVQLSQRLNTGGEGLNGLLTRRGVIGHQLHLPPPRVATGTTYEPTLQLEQDGPFMPGDPGLSLFQNLGGSIPQLSLLIAIGNQRVLHKRPR